MAFNNFGLKMILHLLMISLNESCVCQDAVGEDQGTSGRKKTCNMMKSNHFFRKTFQGCCKFWNYRERLQRHCFAVGSLLIGF